MFERLGIPIVLLFLILGMIGGSEGIGGLAFADYGLAARVGTMAPVLILFDGGMNTSVASFRQVFWPSSILATFGVGADRGVSRVRRPDARASLERIAAAGRDRVPPRMRPPFLRCYAAASYT